MTSEICFARNKERHGSDTAIHGYKLMNSNSTPVIVGAAQFKQEKDDPHPLDPVRLMAKTCTSAINDTGARSLKDLIDTVYVSNISGWSYRNAPGMLAEMLAIKPEKTIYPYVSGNQPQKFINIAAKTITSGESKAVLITGGEAEYAVRRQEKGLLKLDWPEQEKTEKIDGPQIMGSSDYENSYNLILPVGIYAMFETVLKEISGRTWEEHNRHLGQILEHYSSVASKHSCAWSQESYSSEDIITPSPDNRYICYPYTLRMMANRMVDQSAALVMTDVGTAKKLGIDRSQWVYPMGGSDIENIYYTTRRPDLHTSPATVEGTHLALNQAGLTLDNIDMFDLYSCFPSMVQFLIQGIGISENDHRGLTVTGGLPYFGAPLSNYSMHAIVTAVKRIREKPSEKALIAVNGGFNTKLSIGIYGTEPPVVPWGERDDSAIQKSIYSKTLPEPVVQASGDFRIDGYAIHYSRDNSPELGTVIGMLDNNCRTLAHINADNTELEMIKDMGIIGKTVKVRYDSETGKNLINL